MNTLAVRAPFLPLYPSGDLRRAGDITPYSAVSASEASWEGDGLSRVVLDRSLFELSALRNRHQNWDGYESASPDMDSIAQANILLNEAYRAAADEWFEPHLSSSEDGIVTLEWWCKNKKLTIYAEREEPFFIKVWGADVEHEMEDGLVSGQDFVQLWGWLSS